MVLVSQALEKSIWRIVPMIYNKNISFKSNISNINSYLLILLGAIFPLSVSLGTIIIALIFILWLYEGRFAYKYSIIKSNPITYTFLAFFLVHVIGLLWTENMQWGLHIMGKEWRMLLPIIFITIVKKEHIIYYIISFLSAMSISEFLSYGVWLEIIPPFKNASVYNPTPFMSHISYNPFLALSVFILIYLIFFKQSNKHSTEKIVSLFFLVTMSTNIFITGGRAGQVGFFVMISLALLLYFKKNMKMGVMLVLTIVPIVFAIAYTTSDIFHSRVNEARDNILHLETNRKTSVGERITFTQNSLRIIQENLIFGVGTGDFTDEYEKINAMHTPEMDTPSHPHNMYILVLVQTGLLGLIALLSIFYMQLKIAYKKTQYKEIAIALPILFLVIMLSDSYLLGHYTTLLFVYFSSFLYKDFEREKI